MSQVIQKFSHVQCLYTLGANITVKRTASRPMAPIAWKATKIRTSVWSWTAYTL